MNTGLVSTFLKTLENVHNITRDSYSDAISTKDIDLNNISDFRVSSVLGRNLNWISLREHAYCMYNVYVKYTEIVIIRLK